MRLFAAIPLPPQSRDRLLRAQRLLLRSGANMKLVEPENLHITVKFLGNVGDDAVDPARRILAALAEDFSAFEVSLRGVRFFPRQGGVHTVWAGVREGERICEKLLHRARRLFHQFEPSRGKPARPHVTLARLRRTDGSERLREIGARLRGVGLGNFRAETLVLYKSRLSHEGARYEEIGTWKFREDARL